MVSANTHVQVDRESSEPLPLAPFARWPVLGLAGGLALLLLLTATRYGYMGDELYFRFAGYHLDWSYTDQPPLLPLIAGTMDWLFPGSLLALRLPAIAFTTLGLVVSALIARELGGSRRAQVLTAAAFLASPFMVLLGRYLLTSTVDATLTAIVTLLIVRWIRVRDDRLLLAAGIVIAVTLQAKLMIVIFAGAALIAILIAGPRTLLRSRHLWIGIGIALITAVPMLIWQASNGWPQLHMGEVLQGANEDKSSGGSGLLGFAVNAAVFCGFSLGVPLLIYGVWRVFRSSQLRFFGVTFILLTGLFGALGWTGYYVAGLFPVLWAAGAVGLDQVKGRWLQWVAWPVCVLSIAIQVINLPLFPLDSVPDKNSRLDVTATYGWPEIVDDIARVYHSLPADEQKRTAIVSATYEAASAIDRYGPDFGLPRAYSPYLGAWHFGSPPDSADVLIYVGSLPDELRSRFATASLVAHTDNDRDVRNTFQGLEIWVARGQHEPWSQMWPGLRTP